MNECFYSCRLKWFVKITLKRTYYAGATLCRQKLPGLLCRSSSYCLFLVLQVSPSPAPQNSLAPLPLYDQPPTSPFHSPDKRSSQYFPRSPTTNGKRDESSGGKMKAWVSLCTLQERIAKFCKVMEQV